MDRKRYRSLLFRVAITKTNRKYNRSVIYVYIINYIYIYIYNSSDVAKQDEVIPLYVQNSDSPLPNLIFGLWFKSLP